MTSEAEQPLLTPEEWLQRPALFPYKILDADGWDSPADWTQPITLAEMRRRYALSTIEHANAIEEENR